MRRPLLLTAACALVAANAVNVALGRVHPGWLGVLALVGSGILLAAVWRRAIR